jgi:hypothetical protein
MHAIIGQPISRVDGPRQDVPVAAVVTRGGATTSVSTTCDGAAHHYS